MKLKYAIDAARGLADLHDVGVVHADLTIRQYLVYDDNDNDSSGGKRLQLGDFNQGIILQMNTTSSSSNSSMNKPTTTACTFTMTNNYGTTRAPEEYKHELQTKAVDIWSLGSILHHILTGQKVWSEYNKNKAQNAVMDGKLPRVSQAILKSTDPIDELLLKARDMCYVYDPGGRANAREVVLLLETGLKQRTEGRNVVV